MNRWNELIFCMLIQTHKNLKLHKNVLGGLDQKWVWSFRSQYSKIDCALKTEQMEKIDFLHAGTNSRKLKVDSMIFEWSWSKIAKEALLVHETTKSAVF